MTRKKPRQQCKYLHDEKGQGMVEYTFILGFIALAVVLSLTQLGTVLAARYAEITRIINR